MNSESNRDPLEQLAEEFVSRYRGGERPAVSEYADRHPELADAVRAVFPALVLMEDFASSSDGSCSSPIAFDGSMDENTPEQLGDFRIVREIGRGGMGVVYEAEQMCLHRRVAVKVLPQSSLSNQNSRTRFQREAQSAAKLHHTNIVPVFGVGEEDGLQYYAMQYIEGRGLDRVLQDMTGKTARNELWVKRASLISGVSGQIDSAVAQTADDTAHRSNPISTETETGQLADTAVVPRPMPSVSVDHSTIHDIRHPQTRYWDRVARIGVQVSDALEHSHSHGILHRDIKPGNLLLDGQGTVWVTDFGLARAADEEDNVTATGEIVGTLRYSAPEQIEGNVDCRSDVYSLGLTLYELLAMQPAFTERSRRRLADQVMRGEVRPLRKIDSDIPRDLETIVHKAIRREPAARYQSAGELTADLRRFLSGEPIHARRVTLTERMWRWCRRNPAVTSTIVSSALLIMVTLAVAIGVISNDRAALSVAVTQNEELLQNERKNSEELKQANKRQKDATLRAERAAKEKAAVFDYVVLDMINVGLPNRANGKEVTFQWMLDRAANRVGARFADQPAEEAAVRNAIGNVYYQLADFEKARIQYAAALKIRKTNFGNEDLATLKSTRALSNVLNKLGQFGEAFALESEALAVLQRVFGSQHPETLEALNSIGAHLHSQGRYPEALSRLQTAYEGQVKTLGPAHRKTLITMSNIAVTLQQLNRSKEAETMNRQALEMMKSVFGGRHPTTLITLGNLALNLTSQNRHADAELLYRRVVVVRRQLLGTDHPQTLKAISGLAANLEAQNKLVDAHRLYQEIYQRFKSSVGPEHPQTLMAANDMAWSVHTQGQTAEAVRIFKNLLVIAQRKLGPNHPVCTTIEQNLAKIPMNGNETSPKSAASRNAFSTPGRDKAPAARARGPRPPKSKK